MGNSINVALIGFGLSGRVFHAPIIASMPEFNLSKIYTTNPESIKTIKGLYPKTSIVSDVGEIMKDESIHLVVVASPNTSHFTTVKEAIISEKHIVVEKPFTVSSKDADNLIALSKKYGRTLSVYHNRRWDSDFLTVKKVVESKLLGNLVECEMHFDRFRNCVKENAWREECAPGSGVLYDLGSHLVDQAMVLFGLPDSITADIRTQRPEGKVDDSFEIVMDYKGLKVTLKAGVLVRGELPKYVLLGDMGSYIKYGMDVQAADLAGGIIPNVKRGWGKEPEELYGTINTTINGLNIVGKVESEIGDYREYYINIYRSIRKKETAAVSPVDARNVIRLLELANESGRCKSSIEVKVQGGLII
ncbi:MAG: Gfo/Idh/MocA family oxidoreductase [Clostridia bacterium]